MATALVLHQFVGSHFNEKARWALDWKGLPHRRRTYFPGPHAPAMLRLSGQRTTPVLVIDGEVIAGSAAILAALEERFPEGPILPTDHELAAREVALLGLVVFVVGAAIATDMFWVMVAM